MSITVFITAFLTMMVGMALFLLLNFNTLPVVKAGKVTKFCSKTKHVFGDMPNSIKVNGVKIDLSKDEKMLVNGNSMKDYNLFDGQRIYVKRLSDDEKREIATYPVLVFNIVDNPKANDAEYKLRKFVGYVDSDNWRNIFDRFRERIKISETDFVNQCTLKYAKIPLKDRGHLVLSETFDEDKASVLYSLHPVTSVFGKVEYAL